MIRLLTVDVWDTLLRRRCHPDAVKRHLAGWLLAHRASDIPVSLRSPAALLALRLDCERELARASRADPARDDEYAHRDVLARWIDAALGKAAVDRDALVDVLEAEEFEQERRVSYVDPSIAAVLRARPQVQTRFLSDFYMPAERIATLLGELGLGGLVSQGLCSCDVGVNKRSGRLYQALHRQQGVAPAEQAHLGDNRETDVRVPRRLGVVAQRYRNREEERRAAFNRRVFVDRARLFDHLTRDALASLPAPGSRAAGIAFRFGVRSAPLFVGFALFLLEQGARRRHDALYFLSREGAFFADIYSALRGAGASPGAHLPPARHLDISRRASFAASLQAVSIGEMQRVWRGYEPVTMRAWALSLNLDMDTVASWCGRHGLGLEEPLDAPAADSRVGGLLGDAEVVRALRAHVECQAALLREYLAARGLDATTRQAAVVDIGWRGTIQDNLALLLPTIRWSGYYLGLQQFLNPQPLDTSKCAYGPDLNRDDRSTAFFRYLPLIEMLCTPGRPGVVRFARGADGRVDAIRTQDESHDGAAWRAAAAPFQAGVLQSVPRWAEALRCHAVDSDELRATAIACWKRILEQAPAVILDARASLVHDERFGRGRLAPPALRRRSWRDRWRIDLG